MFVVAFLWLVKALRRIAHGFSFGFLGLVELVIALKCRQANLL